MTKLIGILSIGSYYSPWFPYTLSSIYDAVDQIVVSNHGYDLDDKGHSMGPLAKATESIKHIDIEHKVVELTDIEPRKLRHPYPLGTQKAANARRKTPEGEGFWFDQRGANITAAQEKAVDIGADWILKIDSDQCCYKDVQRLGDPQFRRDYLYTPRALYQWEFMGDIGPPLDGDKNHHLSIPPPASPWIDTVYLYPARYKTWYVGAGAIVDLDSGFMPTEDLHCAHLRSANPWYLPDHEKLKHFHDRRAWQLFTNDYGTWDDPRLWEQAEMDSESQFESVQRKGIPSQKPPEACMWTDALDYILFTRDMLRR